jgi:hypothetical protein
MDDQGKFFLEDPTAQKIWKETVKLSEIKASDFKALFIVGGVSPPCPGERNGANQ